MKEKKFEGKKYKESIKISKDSNMKNIISAHLSDILTLTVLPE